MTYDGYENYETRTCALWLDTVHLDNEIITIKLLDLNAKYPEDPDKVRSLLAGWIKDKLLDKYRMIERMFGETDNYGDPADGFGHIVIDLLQNSIEKINFKEVAEQFIDN